MVPMTGGEFGSLLRAVRAADAALLTVEFENDRPQTRLVGSREKEMAIFPYR